MKEDKGV